MQMRRVISKALILAVALALGGAPEVVQAWQQPGQNPESESPPVINGTTVNPAQGPLTPVPAAPEPQPQSTAPAQPPAATPSTQMGQKPVAPEQEPLGTAAAEQVPTNGGAASRPAGAAIAPAKQHQKRALLLKLGAVAAAGIAIGTVAGLSKGTSSTPSGARAAAVR
jgi:type IV secretory pathway VirB10-like protein